jgi:electron transfer flavoprotein alpha subunit
MSADPPDRPRRDPRAERAARLARGNTAAPEAAAEPARKRVDPRAERTARLARQPAGEPQPIVTIEEPVRKRVDPRARLRDGATVSVATPAPVATAIPLTVVDDANGFVALLLALDAGARRRRDREALGAARALADEGARALVGVVCLSDPAGLRFDAAAAGLDRLVALVHPDFGKGFVAARVGALAAVCAALKPAHLVFSDTAEGGELGRRVAARLGERAAANVVRLSAQTCTSLADSGRSEITRPTPRIILVRPDTFAPVAAEPRREARPLPAPAFIADAGLIDHGLLPVDPASLPLGEAELIVSAGNGVSDWKIFHRLAEALGAAEAGSRVVCDNGDLPRDRQVGASGSIVVPRCYIALGISGASQHLDGIADCPRVIAVNSDPHAEIMKRADLAVVADVQALMPALVEALGGRP